LCSIRREIQYKKTAHQPKLTTKILPMLHGE